MLGAVSSSQMTISSARTTYFGETNIVTPIIEAAFGTMGPGVMAPCKGVCILGTSIMMASLSGTRKSPV